MTKTTVLVTFLCSLIMVADSYDVAALSFAAPELISRWHIDKFAVGTVFSASLFGLLVGSIVFGFIGDRLGRKTAIIAGCILFSVLTAATGLASNYSTLLALRFLACVGLGGAVPNAVALTNEYSPPSARVTTIAWIFAGYALGGTLGGVVAGQIMPAFGWPAIFYFGGAISSLIGIAVAIWLPESKLYLAMRAGKAHATGTAAAKTGNKKSLAAYVAALFGGTRSLMTPLVWVIYVANSITLFGLVSWLPVLIEAGGMARSVASAALALFFLGGAIGGLVASRVIDKSGLAIMSAAALIACPVVASIGVARGSAELLLGAAAAAGFFTIGIQNSLHGVAGKIYPTEIRANGMGWALGIGKVGSIMGPFIGGVLLSWAVPVEYLFVAAAAPIAIVAIASFFLMRLYNRHVHSTEDGPVAIETIEAQRA